MRTIEVLYANNATCEVELEIGDRTTLLASGDLRITHPDSSYGDIPDSDTGYGIISIIATNGNNVWVHDGVSTQDWIGIVIIIIGMLLLL